MADERLGSAAPRVTRDNCGERSARWREIDREMQETARRLQRTYELGARS